MGRHKKIYNDIKVCTKCKKENNISEFRFRKDTQNYISSCKLCESEYSKKYEDNRKYKGKSSKAYYAKNISNAKQIRKKNYEKNKEKISKKNKINYLKIKEKRESKRETLRKYEENYRKENASKIREYRNVYKKERRKNDPLYKLKQNIGNLIRSSFIKSKHKKNSLSQNILHCSIEEFKKYIESKFEYWMSWKNYGKYNGELMFGWDLDHIIPLASAKTEEDIIKLNHYTNLQPLCSKINRDIKRNIFLKIPIS